MISFRLDMIPPTATSQTKRLVMVDEKGRDLGGWCVQAVQDQIENQLLASRRRKTRR